MKVWIEGSGMNASGTKLYKSEAVMRASLLRMFRNRARGPNSEMYVYVKGSPYGGPDMESQIGKIAFEPDGETIRFFSC